MLRYLADPQMRRRVTAATNKVQAYNGFSEWVHFGNRGVITDNDPVEQEKLDIAQAVRELQAEGWKDEPRTWPRSRPT